MDINATLIGQAITFALLVMFTMKFVWPPLNKMLNDRAKQIADGLSAAEKGKQELLDAEARVASELRQVQMRAVEIISNADKRAGQIIEEAKTQALKESQHLISEAQNHIEHEFLKLKEQLRSQVAALAIDGAKAILKAEIDATKHASILNDLGSRL